MTAWSDPADLSTVELAKHLRLTDVGNDSYVLTYVRAQTHYAQLVRINRDSATAIGTPLAFHVAATGHTLLTENAPELTPALYVGKRADGLLVYAFAEVGEGNTFARFYLLSAASGMSVLDSDAATHVGAVSNAACADLGDGALVVTIGVGSAIRYSLALASPTSVNVLRTGQLAAWTSNTNIPLSLVRTGYRTGLLASSRATNPAGLTLANAEAFTITLTTQAMAGSADPSVTQFSGTEAELRLLPGSYPVWNGTLAVGVLDATATPYADTPFLAELDAQIFTEAPVGFTKALPTWAELGGGSPRLHANTTDGEITAVARVVPDGSEVERWQLITDALISPVQVDFPFDDVRFTGLSTTSTSVDNIAVVKAGAYYLVAASYVTSAGVNKLLMTAYKDDAALYGYVQDNQLRVIQRPLPSPGVLYPVSTVQVSQINGLDSDLLSTTPMAPTNLTITSTSYTDTVGITRAEVTFQWDEVVDNTDGSPFLDFAYYSVFFKVDSPSASYQFAGNSFDAVLVAGGFEPGSEYQAIVYAVNQKNISSLPSTPVYFMTAGDSTPPPIPSAPTLTSKLGTIRVEWDGLGSIGEVMPADFAYAEVHMSTISGFAPSTSTLVAKIIGRGYAIATNLTPATTYYVRLVGVDTSGNASNPSAVSSINPVFITGADIEANSITANNIAAGAIDGQVITGAVIQTAWPESQGGQNNRILLDSSRLEAYDLAGNPTFTVQTADGSVSLTGTINTGSAIYGSSFYGGSIRIGSEFGDAVFKADSDAGIYLGAQDPFSAPFRVDLDGNLYASSAEISGSIVGDSTISIGEYNNVFKVDAQGLYLGSASYSTAPFRVSMSGQVFASDAIIQGDFQATSIAASSYLESPEIVGGSITSTSLTSTTITGGTITIGEGEYVFKAGEEGIWLGSAYSWAAPFSVTPAGEMYAVTANITGTINAYAGMIGGWIIEQGYLYGYTDEQGYIWGSIYGGYIYGTDIEAATLTGTSIVGGTITIGEGANAFHADETGIYLGGEDLNSAPFSVDPGGVVYATAGVIGGWSMVVADDEYGVERPYLFGDANSIIRGGSIERARMWALAERVHNGGYLELLQQIQLGLGTVWIFEGIVHDPSDPTFQIGAGLDLVGKLLEVTEVVQGEETFYVNIYAPVSDYIAEDTAFSLVVAVRNYSNWSTPARRAITDIFIDLETQGGTGVENVYWLNGTLPTAIDGWDIYTYTIVRGQDSFDGFPNYRIFANKTNYKAETI